jgi:hypothetical protein
MSLDRLEGRGVGIRVAAGENVSPRRLDRFWGLLSPLANEERGQFLWR